ncbi:hypothetical protein [Pseudoxanthomonas wuyuanensis]|uniref:Uncharacterized protein n=1 Tax=Pseudoxanthomonas wuyuanensis TaxID=1073196 RepID=A0A286DF67_9GAMM|nr:hypothetical protein [Pseudoxanthomonas wuyuanensis]KAF1719596.1 hypothetical protein CSC75_14810 [Pseudoxanthomonas wuyuanensis]SOD57417.1 hypothetical protein SAMN06296416_11351 [Pseudoxanthomonas wuyuanensis]
MKRRSYLAAAFNARPLGMPIPPNWFGLAAFALAGVFLSPGFFLLGAGAEAIYLYWLANNRRFRNSVDAGALQEDPSDRRYRELLDPLPVTQRKRQDELEAKAREIMALLTRSPLMAAHADSLEQLVWLHLRLLVARSAIARVVQTAREESKTLQAQEDVIDARLAKADELGAELRRSLEQQKAVIDQRQAGHADAARRLEHVDSELQRIGLQVALLREQALLATDEASIGNSLDALAASFNEANRWLDGQRDLLGPFDLGHHPRLPAGVLRPSASRSAMTEGESS